MFSPDKWFKNPSTGSFYDHTIDQSLRFDDGSSAYLSRTPSSASNRKTFTFSAWIKVNPKATNYPPIFSADQSAPDFVIRLSNTGSLQLVLENGGGGNSLLITNRLFRDPSSWYHLVVAIDTTNSTADDRMKIYVNGVQETSFASRTNPSLNFDTKVNNTVLHMIGLQRYGSYWDGYMAEVHFVDGTALTPSSFGETKDGVWIANEYSGSHGTNGFYLPFDDSSAIGDDESANTNDWTANNFAASDVMLDSPTNNFATLNILDSHAASTYSEGNLKFADGGGDGANAHSTIAIPEISDSDTYYAEIRVNASGYAWGISPATLSGAGNSTTRTGMLTLYYNGRRYNGTTAQGGGNNEYATISVGDIFGIKAGNGEIRFFQNGTDRGAAFTGLSGSYKFGMWAVGSAGNGISWNFGQDSTFHGQESAGTTTDKNGIGLFQGSEASNNKALCTSNLPDITIGPGQATQADDHFNTVLWTGNGSTQSITGVGFAPDWVWNKCRSVDQRHALFDSVRGATKILNSDSTDDETTASGVTSFDSDGWSTGSSYNQSSRTFVSWNWKAGGSASSNSNGTITSQVSANTDAGFSIVSFTGNSTNPSTIGHGLSSAPEMIIYKSRDATNGTWYVGHDDIGWTHRLKLDATSNRAASSALWNDTAPTSSVFTISSSLNYNGDNIIAYCFHSVASFSKVGFYEGNGQTDGSFVYLGFRPAFMMVKDMDATRNWIIIDSKRSTANVGGAYLTPNTSGAEASLSFFDFLSNGVKWRLNSATAVNASSTYIYLAFAEAPFKFSNAR
tara:strand:- start:624 stop:2996 length:2373 start_codon:yes stop_codon:yes gene_type:complete